MGDRRVLWAFVLLALATSSVAEDLWNIADFEEFFEGALRQARLADDFFGQTTATGTATATPDITNVYSTGHFFSSDFLSISQFTSDVTAVPSSTYVTSYEAASTDAPAPTDTSASTFVAEETSAVSARPSASHGESSEAPAPTEVSSFSVESLFTETQIPTDTPTFSASISEETQLPTATESPTLIVEPSLVDEVSSTEVPSSSAETSSASPKSSAETEGPSTQQREDASTSVGASESATEPASASASKVAISEAEETHSASSAPVVETHASPSHGTYTSVHVGGDSEKKTPTLTTATATASATVAKFVRPTSLSGFSAEQLAQAVRVSLRGIKAAAFKGSNIESAFKSEIAKAANKALSKLRRRGADITEEDIETPELFKGSDLERAFKVQAMRAANEAVVRSKRASSVVVTVDDIVILFYIDTSTGLDLVMLLAVYSADGTPIIISGDLLAGAINDSVAALAALGLDVSGVVLNPVDPSNPDGGSPSNPGGSTAASSSKNLAWVAGPVVGGIALVGIAVGGVFYYRKTRTGTYNLERIRIPSDNAIGSHTVKADGTDIEAGPEAPLPGVIAPPTEDMTMATVNDWNGAAA
eukprot:Opistho-2@13669